MVAAIVTQIDVEKSPCHAFCDRTATALAGPMHASANTVQKAALHANCRRQVKAMAGTSETIAVSPNRIPVCMLHHRATPLFWQGGPHPVTPNSGLGKPRDGG